METLKGKDDNTMTPELHIGAMVENEFRRQGRQVKWLAQSLGCNRSNVYGIFRRKNIDVFTLIELSDILQHNFIADILPMVEKHKQEENR